MGKIILFSPIGGTDPISSLNFHEGALLHICRYYKPDKVYLYMSKEILENEKNDKRYTYCLKELSKLVSKEIKYEIIEKEKLEDVQDFDYFYEDFKKELDKIQSIMNEDDKLILNISSGTPAMKSALLILKVLYDINCDAIQVTTPEKKMNHRNTQNYNVEEIWKKNKDNEKEATNRANIVMNPNLINVKNENLICNFIESYSYLSAIEVAKTMDPKITKRYMEMLYYAQARLMMDFNTMEKYKNSMGGYKLPVEDEENRKLFEYALNLSIKIKKKEYADFLRAITPIILDLYIRILENVAKINIYDYTYKNDEGVIIWDKYKLKENKLVDKKLRKKIKEEKYYTPVYSSSLYKIIKKFVKRDSPIITCVSFLSKKVEPKLRNIAAHQVISVNEDFLKEKFKLSTEEVLGNIKKLFEYIDDENKEIYKWNSYEEMNEYIINAVKNIQ